MSASLPDELNTFYARFESTSPAVEVQKAQEDHCPPVISRADVCRTLKRINTRKAPGPDGIPGRALKVCADQLADVFADIFNVSLLQSVVPTCFKETIIVPVPKKTKILSLNDYRPVALTSTIMKCFERPQAVRMGSTTSSTLTLNTGTPQGCVLSPLLYSLFTHDCVATHSSNYIIKFADDTTVIGLITGDDETAYREEEEAERGTHPPLHQWDYGGESQQLQVPRGSTSVRTSPGLITLTLSQSQPDSGSSSSAGCGGSTWTPGSSAASTGEESILTGCIITAWYSSCTTLNRKALQRVVKAAQHITRTELPSMEDLYTQRCRRKATKIIKDPSHPATNCSACCRLAD
ncbi:hypothetical protein L3Q82_022696, partial [Scortum barcoo]